MQIPINFNPRPYQAEALRALENGAKLAVWCWSRRGGKDFTAFAYAVKKMVSQPMNIVLVFPVKEQGRGAFWDNVENDGFKTIEHIPKDLIMFKNNDDMKLTLKNGSTFQILGTSRPDKLRGANGKLYIFSEFVDIPKAALDVIRPIVRNNGGQIIVQSTPKVDGISGASFKAMFDRAIKHPKQFASRVTAEQYLSDEELEDIRQECIEENGNDFFYRQEYMCDWGQASASSYYGNVLQKLKAHGSIGLYPYDPAYPTYTVWDWGMSDSTAIGFFQFYPVDGQPQVRIIDAYQTNDIGIQQLVVYVSSKPYHYGWHFFPHDVVNRDSDAIERIEKFRNFGLINSSLLPKERKEDGITRVMDNIMNTVFNEATTSQLRRILALYKRKYNPLTGDYIGPEHNSASHYADMVRYLFKAIDCEFDEKTCEHYNSQASREEFYEEDLASTSYYQPQSSLY